MEQTAIRPPPGRPWGPVDGQKKRKNKVATGALPQARDDDEEMGRSGVQRMQFHYSELILSQKKSKLISFVVVFYMNYFKAKKLGTARSPPTNRPFGPTHLRQCSKLPQQRFFAMSFPTEGGL